MTIAGTRRSRPPETADTPVTGSPRKAFRADIQGVRALAVLMVVLNHAGWHRLSGGYVGVDIFFVVSGFVITGSLLGPEHRDGISLSAFYAARARRILPMATVVLVATVVASWHLLNFVRAGRIVTDAVWAGLFAANIHFSAVGTDYFSADLPPSPLQHYWSLAVEEQFYLVWPLLLGSLIFGVTRCKGRHAEPRSARPRVAIALALVIVISLAWSIRQTGSAPTAAFFSTFTRAWELAIGALLMVGATTVARVPWKIRAALSWSGLAGAIASGLLLSSDTPFPGSAALLPVLSTAAIIAGGTGESRGGATLLLALRPMQAIGNWSYSFYLWHWPMLIIAAGYAGHELRFRHKIALIIAALALSYASFRLVESPFRRAKPLKTSRRMSLALWPAAVAVLLVTCLWAAASLRLPEVSEAAGNPATTNVTDPSVAIKLGVTAAAGNEPIPARLSPPLAKLSDDFPVIGRCFAEDGFTRSDICQYGDLKAKRSLVLIGDSHATMWLPAFEAMGKKYGWLIYTFLKRRCTSVDVTIWRKDIGLNRECTQWRDWALRTAPSLHPQRVVVSNTFDYMYVADQNGKPKHAKDDVTPLWMAGMRNTIRALTKNGARATIFTDTPRLPGNPQECLLRRHATLATCAVQLNTTRLGRQLALDGAKATRADLLDVEPWFCWRGLCPIVVNSIVVYRDDNHVSKTYAEYLADTMAQQLQLTATA